MADEKMDKALKALNDIIKILDSLGNEEKYRILRTLNHWYRFDLAHKENN